MKNTRGYVLALTLMIISMSVILVSAIIQRALSYQRQARLMVDREQARSLALGALELVISRISLVIPSEKEKKEEVAQPQQQEETKKKATGEKMSPMHQWALQFLPLLNKWHTLEVTEKSEGIDGTISFYVSSEEGKINLNFLYTLLDTEGKKQQAPTQQEQAETKKEEAAQTEQQEETKKKAADDKKSPLQTFDELIKKETQVSIRQVLREWRAQHTRPLEDPTELILLKSFVPLKDALFVERQPQQQRKQPIYVTDLFTTVPGSGTLNPWLLSQSLRTLLGFKENKEVKINAQLVKNLKPNMNWQTEWDKVLAPLYGKKFGAIAPEIRALFSSQFKPTAFSVVLYAKTGSITQRLGALLETTEPPATISPKSIVFKVTKLYWL